MAIPEAVRQWLQHPKIKSKISLFRFQPDMGWALARGPHDGKSRFDPGLGNTYTSILIIVVYFHTS